MSWILLILTSQMMKFSRRAEALIMDQMTPSSLSLTKRSLLNKLVSKTSN